MSCLDMPALLLVCWNGFCICGIAPSKMRSLRPQCRPPSQAQQTQEQHPSPRLQWGVEPQVLLSRLPPLYFPQDSLAGFRPTESREKQTFIIPHCLSVKKIERNTGTLRKKDNNCTCLWSMMLDLQVVVPLKHISRDFYVVNHNHLFLINNFLLL